MKWGFHWPFLTVPEAAEDAAQQVFHFVTWTMCLTTSLREVSWLKHFEGLYKTNKTKENKKNQLILEESKRYLDARAIPAL